jgi:hypothetical protein
MKGFAFPRSDPVIHGRGVVKPRDAHLAWIISVFELAPSGTIEFADKHYASVHVDAAVEV